jgi:hypothetical protein
MSIWEGRHPISPQFQCLVMGGKEKGLAPKLKERLRICMEEFNARKGCLRFLNEEFYNLSIEEIWARGIGERLTIEHVHSFIIITLYHIWVLKIPLAPHHIGGFHHHSSLQAEFSFIQ